MAQAQKDKLSRRNSIAAVSTYTMRKSVVEDVSEGGRGKKAMTRKTSASLMARPGFKRQRSISCSPCSPEDLAEIRSSRKSSKSRI